MIWDKEHREPQDCILNDIEQMISEIKCPPLNPTIDKDTIISMLERCSDYIVEEPSVLYGDLEPDDLIPAIRNLEDACADLHVVDLVGCREHIDNALLDLRDFAI